MNIMAATEFLAVDVTGGTAVGWIGYIILGGIAGWVASKIVRDGGSGILMDIVVGVVGAFITGLILNQVGYDVNSRGYWFTFLIAFVGAVVLLLIIRLVRRP
jgi:uncharacterized membrane protein YeaQ/YmgE (transglycosylase-associated protein family)